MTENVKMTIGDSYVVAMIIQSMLVGKDGTERKLPFNLKYKLQRNLSAIATDSEFFDKERDALIRELGEEADGVIKVKDENLEEFNKRLFDMLSTDTDHNLIKLAPEDMDNFNDIDISCSDLNVFIRFMVDDPQLFEDMDKKPEVATIKTDKKKN